jgi:acyl carrier protein
LANTRFYILDPELRLVPTGAIGELHIGGVGLARGYLHRSELTAEKFIADPFSQNQSARLYKTGDLARFLLDGNVECLGRLDHQVKIRGFRVETGEVETILRQHPGIADALVTTRPDSLGEQRLVGYLISRNGSLANAELRDFARTRLPLYMVPSQFVFLKQFPLTPNGKVDVRNLPAPGDALQTTSASVTPRNANEQRLADIWQEVLMLNGVSIDDDFFDLGGDSLTATRAFARTNQAFGTALTLREMLDHPTIRRLSDVIARSPNALPALPPILPRRMRPVTPVDE